MLSRFSLVDHFSGLSGLQTSSGITNSGRSDSISAPSQRDKRRQSLRAFVRPTRQETSTQSSYSSNHSRLASLGPSNDDDDDDDDELTSSGRLSSRSRGIGNTMRSTENLSRSRSTLHSSSITTLGNSTRHTSFMMGSHALAPDNMFHDTTNLRAVQSAVLSERMQTLGYSNTFCCSPVLDEESREDSKWWGAALRTRKPTSAPSRGNSSTCVSESTASSAPNDLPPPYSCTVHMEGLLALRRELITPFECANSSSWVDCYAILHGSSLHLYRYKPWSVFSMHNLRGSNSTGSNDGTCLSDFKNVPIGKLLGSYSLQHAEVGIALDHRPVLARHKTTLAKWHLFLSVTSFLPASHEAAFRANSARFKPKREFVFRVRAEAEQFLLCAPTECNMLDWVEKMCQAIDISLPLEVRSEPRQRTLPRRGQRMRLLEGNFSSMFWLGSVNANPRRWAAHGNRSSHAGGRSDNGSGTVVAAGSRYGIGSEMGFSRRLVEQQEQLFETMYPDFARGVGEASSSETSTRTAPREDEEEMVLPEESRTVDHETEWENVLLWNPGNPFSSRNSSYDGGDVSRLSSRRRESNSISDERVSAAIPTGDMSSRGSGRQPPNAFVRGTGERLVGSTREEQPHQDSHTRSKSATRSRTNGSEIPTTSIRYRRRIAPILFYSSPRASQIILYKGCRMRICEDVAGLEVWIPPGTNTHNDSEYYYNGTTSSHPNSVGCGGMLSSLSSGSESGRYRLLRRISGFRSVRHTGDTLVTDSSNNVEHRSWDSDEPPPYDDVVPSVPSGQVIGFQDGGDYAGSSSIATSLPETPAADVFPAESVNVDIGTDGVSLTQEFWRIDSDESLFDAVYESGSGEGLSSPDESERTAESSGRCNDSLGEAVDVGRCNVVMDYEGVAKEPMGKDSSSLDISKSMLLSDGGGGTVGGGGKPGGGLSSVTVIRRVSAVPKSVSVAFGKI